MQSVHKVSEPTCILGDCRQGVQPDCTCYFDIQGTVYWGASCLMFFKPSFTGLSARGYRLVIKLRIYFKETARVGVKSVYKGTEPTLTELCWGGAFVYGFRTYLQGTVCKECSLIVFF